MQTDRETLEDTRARFLTWNSQLDSNSRPVEKEQENTFKKKIDARLFLYNER